MRSLPEKYRAAWRIEKGYEIHLANGCATRTSGRRWNDAYEVRLLRLPKTGDRKQQAHQSSVDRILNG